MDRKTLFSIFLFVCSVVFAWWFGSSGAVLVFLNLFSSVSWLAAFFAGLGFASVFTAAPATIALGTLAVSHSVWQVALIGGLGALCGDLAILYVFSRIGRRAQQSVVGIPTPRFVRLHRIRHVLSQGPFRIFLWITGAIVIASPLPDELGLAILGVTHIPLYILAPMAYLLNTAGIAFVGMIAVSVAV